MEGVGEDTYLLCEVPMIEVRVQIMQICASYTKL